MGFTPQEVRAMSMWQWQAALNGYVDANSPKQGARLTEAEADDLFAWIEAGDVSGPLTTQTYAFNEAGELAPAGIVTFSIH